MVADVGDSLMMVNVVSVITLLEQANGQLTTHLQMGETDGDSFSHDSTEQLGGCNAFLLLVKLQTRRKYSIIQGASMFRCTSLTTRLTLPTRIPCAPVSATAARVRRTKYLMLGVRIFGRAVLQCKTR